MRDSSSRKQGAASPCAACKLLRRRCAEDCVFAPYFPAEEPHKFASVHKVFGASNVNKMLQDLPEHQRGDAVSSLVYEANARVRDPVYGCVGAISSLQQQIDALQTQLALAQAEVVHMRMRHYSSSRDVMPDVGGKGLGSWNGNGWNSMQHEHMLGGPQGMTIDWKPPGSPSSFLVKRVLRLDIPVDRYPNFNFVGRLLGPRGNSLKRVEASTGCRVFIRGKGSIKDADKEESLRGKPGYEHLNEPLHILIEAEAAEVPASIVDVRLKQAKDIIEELLKPVDESQDLYKRQQLRELAILNNIKEESPQPRGSVSPFSSSGLKRPKTSW